MRERIVEDWLTRINERGYQAAFGQILTAMGHKVLRISHSPYEHGKDVLSATSDGEVHAYQLKHGDIGLKEWDKGYAQICALVETLPVHPSLPANYIYRPWLVTTGTFSDPVLDRIHQTNASWERRGLPKLELRDGRWMHCELTRLSTDFWPINPPDVRLFRTLYLVDGRGDFDPQAFARFMRIMLVGEFTVTDLERRSAAANIFCSYILGEFYGQNDHWSIFRGWIMTAAAIACACEGADAENVPMQASFSLARDAAEDALKALSKECRAQGAFKPTRPEWDEYTRVRNTVGLGAWAAWCLLNLEDQEDGIACIELTKSFERQNRIVFWGESAFPFICSMAWLLEQREEVEQSQRLLINWLLAIIEKQQRESEEPLPDPYVSAEDVLKQMAENASKDGPSQRKAIQSYSLFPLVLLLVRRNYRDLLSKVWRKLSCITMSIFEYDSPAGYLEWTCEKGIERDFIFMQPQSYRELEHLASKPPTHKLPSALREDLRFRLMFLLAFPHRLAWSIVGSLDANFKDASSRSADERST
jgi:hypothetical protein